MGLHGTIMELQKRLDARPEKVGGLNGTFQFDLGGNEPGTYHLVVANGRGKIVEGPADNPNVTISMDGADFLAMVGGRLNPMAAFMGGKLKIKGDVVLAMQLQSLLS